jgi:hypothetical protein
MENPRLIFQDHHFVGYIKQVNPKFVIVHFPSSPLLKKFFWNAESLQAGIVGNYILIEGEDHGFLGQIVELSLPEKERLNLNQTAFEREDFHPFAKAEILLSFDFYEVKAVKGLSQLPPIGSKVFVCSTEMLMSFLKDFGNNKNNSNEPGFEFSYLPNLEGNKISISPQAIFGRHCAIVGTTGGGKSYTVAKLIEEIIAKNGKAILFDATGEYETMAANNKTLYYKFNSDGDNRIFFHHTNLRETDYYALFRPAGQLQLPKLQEAFKNLRLVKLIKSVKEEERTDIEKEIIDKGYITEKGLIEKASKSRTPLLKAYNKYPECNAFTCDLNISMIAYQVYYECVYEQGNSPDFFGVKNERDLGLCFSLISRISTLIKSPSFENVFGLNNSSTEVNNFYTIFQKFISPQNSEKNILIVSLDRISTENNLKVILMNALGRFLLEKALEKKFKANPVITFLDEAHLFLNRNVKDEYSIEVELNAFERIAKECRKFGLFLALSTQMPRDIPVGILSQFGTFIVHRLINQRDRETIEFACSEATRSSLSFLPTLTPGQALITGVDFPMPVIVQIEKPAIEPDSKTPQIFKSN